MDGWMDLSSRDLSIPPLLSRLTRRIGGGCGVCLFCWNKDRFEFPNCNCNRLYKRYLRYLRKVTWPGWVGRYLILNKCEVMHFVSYCMQDTLYIIRFPYLFFRLGLAGWLGLVVVVVVVCASTDLIGRLCPRREGGKVKGEKDGRWKGGKKVRS